MARALPIDRPTWDADVDSLKWRGEFPLVGWLEYPPGGGLLGIEFISIFQGCGFRVAAGWEYGS